MIKRLVSLALALALALSLIPAALAATGGAAKGENIFFYATDRDGKAVLLKVIPLDDLKAISHGQLSDLLAGGDTGVNYYISTTDEYPTTQYCEARGVTIMDLVEYVKGVSSADGVGSVSFYGEDTIRFMATDGFGAYNRPWSYNELYGVARYYFGGMYETTAGWTQGWEIAGAGDSKSVDDLEVYYNEYRDNDQYYDDKRAVFEAGVRTVPILATSSNSGRTTTDTISASAEPGIARYIANNGGAVTGCLAGTLEDTWSLRLALPMTESDLMVARRTAPGILKLVYNMRLDMENAQGLVSRGRVEEARASVVRSGDTLTVTMSCATPGATVYYSFDGAPQTPYTRPVEIDISGRDVASNPVSIYMTAVREGWDDAGIITARYPGMPPAFEAIHSGLCDEDLVFRAADSVSRQEWEDWTGAVSGIALRTPDISGYPTLDGGSYRIDNTNKTITFDKSLFPAVGSYSFIISAAAYSNKSVSLSIRQAAPGISAEDSYLLGDDVTLSFDDESYQQGLTVFLTPPGGSRSMISPSYLDRSVPGQVTVKGAYFAMESSPAKEPGEYTLTLSNNQYHPDSQDVIVFLRPDFADVPPDAWYYDAVQYVVRAGLFAGTSSTTFSPDMGMTRAMLVTVLWKIWGSGVGGRDGDGDGDGVGNPGAAPGNTHPTPGPSSFTDVGDDMWYTGAIAWAVENGIVEGYGDGRFGTYDSITREQMATMLYLYSMGFGAWGLESADEGGELVRPANTGQYPATDISQFADADKISEWALNAIGWVTSAGIINGMGDGTFSPQGTATRAQAAKLIMQLINDGK